MPHTPDTGIILEMACPSGSALVGVDQRSDNSGVS